MSEKGVTLAHCPKCGSGRRSGSYRRQFCPSCGWTRDRDPAPEKIFCCAECEKPLALTLPLEGLYCTHCDYAPSMQDTFLRPWKQ